MNQTPGREILFDHEVRQDRESSTCQKCRKDCAGAVDERVGESSVAVTVLTKAVKDFNSSKTARLANISEDQKRLIIPIASVKRSRVRKRSTGSICAPSPSMALDYTVWYSQTLKSLPERQGAPFRASIDLRPAADR
jgi:hypothetical protein